MTDKKGIIIFPGGGIRELHDLSLESLQETVGGYIEAIGLDGAIGFVDEHAKLRNEPPPVNQIATKLLREAGGRPEDYVVGTFVLTGPAEDAEPTSVTESWEERIKEMATA